jgi:uncharacterized membrane protein YbhN (UPF0104 family)
VLAVGLTGVFALAIADSWHALGGRLQHVSHRDLALATLALAVYYLVFLQGWRILIRGCGDQLGYRPALAADVAAMLAKYVPGGVWAPIARVVVATRYGARRGPVLVGLGYEVVLSTAAGLVVLAAAVTGTRYGISGAGLVGVVVALLALALVAYPPLVGAIVDRVTTRVGAERIPTLPARVLLRVTCFYAATWLLSGLSLWLVARTIVDVPFAAGVVYLAGVSAVAAAVTVLAAFSPAGLGPREGAMFVLLAPIASRQGALEIAILSRVVVTAAEVVVLAVAAVPLRARRPTPTAETVPSVAG